MKLDTLKIQGLLSQQKNEDIEKLLGISRPTYLKLRKNPALIKLGDFVKICDHLDRNPAQFIETQ